MDEYSVIADILETLGRWIALSLALLLSGIAIGLIASWPESLDVLDWIMGLLP